MYQVLSKDIIETQILIHLPSGKRGSKPRAHLYEIVNTILYKFKTGVHWHLLPVDSLFSENTLGYQAVFHHYRKWCEQDSRKAC